MNRAGGLAPIVISVIVLGGFAVLSFLAMRPEIAGITDNSVVLYLLGAWSTLTGNVVQYWVGSSNSSARKDEQSAKKDEVIQTMAAAATGTGSGGGQP